MTGRPDPAAEAAPPTAAPRQPVQRWRLVLARAATRSGDQQRAQVAAWEDALRGCPLPLVGLDGTPPRPRVAIGAPLAPSIAGEAELVDTWLTERCQAWRVREALAVSLPDGFRLVDVQDVWLGEASLPGQVVASVYRAGFAAPGFSVDRLRSAVAAIMRAEALPRTRRKGERTVAYDLRPFVERLDVGEREAGRIEMRMVLRHDPEKGVGRPEEVLGELGDRLGTELAPVGLVRERLVLASDRAGPAPAPSGGPEARGQRDRCRRGG